MRMVLLLGLVKVMWFSLVCLLLLFLELMWCVFWCMKWLVWLKV